jgi:hypothetical protein
MNIKTLDGIESKTRDILEDFQWDFWPDKMFQCLQFLHWAFGTTKSPVLRQLLVL